jgi:hypothetical protein
MASAPLFHLDKGRVGAEDGRALFLFLPLNQAA